MKDKLKYYTPEILLICMILFIFLFVFIYSKYEDSKIMKINYCFQENMDGSLYHYVCKK